MLVSGNDDMKDKVSPAGVPSAFSASFLHIFFLGFLSIEAATGGVLLKKVVLEISQNSQESTCGRDPFLIK